MKVDRGNVSRRRFLTQASVAAWLTATHGSGIWGALSAAPSSSTSPGETARIRELRLETSAPLAEMREYYGGLLGLRILEEGPEELTVLAGETPITFHLVEPGGSGDPFYHFAFNIPENKILEAREWQGKCTSLIPPYEHLRDPQYPRDITHFERWNAHSVFFWDPAGNLLEYIARHELRNAADGPFSAADILYASEIGLIVDDVLDVATKLGDTFGLGPYKSSSEQFTAVGDELGLLLVMKRGRILGFDEGRPADVFGTQVALGGPQSAQFSPPGYPCSGSHRVEGGKRSSASARTLRLVGP